MASALQESEEEAVALDAFVNLIRAAESVSSRIYRHLAGRGITSSQLGVLEMLFHQGPLSQGRIGRKMLKSGGNMTLVIDNLEKRGLVQRNRKESDRRFYIIDLTPAGRKLIGELFPIHVRKISEQMGVLSRAEQEELGRICRKLGKEGLENARANHRKGALNETEKER